MSSRATAALVLAVLSAAVGVPAESAAGSPGSTVPGLSATPPVDLSSPHTSTTASTTPVNPPVTPVRTRPAAGHADLPFTGIDVELELTLAAGLLGGGLVLAAAGRVRRR